MLEALKIILKIQQLDMQMIQLMRLKKARKKELDTINGVKNDLQKQTQAKEHEIVELKKSIRFAEQEVAEVADKMKKLESQQSSIKKVEEFNALTHEMAHTEREKAVKEQRLSDLYDRLAAEEDGVKALKQSMESTEEGSKALEEEIHESVHRINGEGIILKRERDLLVQGANPEIFRIYERLLNNKKDQVVVPIENRCCSGCHIVLTAQHENLVRKGERLVFCEHCSRIHYWQEAELFEQEKVETKSRRRRPSKVS